MTDPTRASAPNPGSPEATEKGCTCPVMDNSRGRGAYGGMKDENGEPLFWITEGCPLHG